MVSGVWPSTSIIRAKASNSSMAFIGAWVTFSASDSAVVTSQSSGTRRQSTLVFAVKPLMALSATSSLSAA